MSTEEELAAIGRLVKDAADAKRNVVLLKGTLEGYSKTLNKASLTINGLLSGITYEEPEMAMDFPTPEQIRAAYAEYRAESKRAGELSSRITALGI